MFARTVPAGWNASKPLSRQSEFMICGAGADRPSSYGAMHKKEASGASARTMPRQAGVNGYALSRSVR